MQEVIKYIEQEVKRRNAAGYELTPWVLQPKNAAGIVSGNPEPTVIDGGSMVIVTKVSYVVSTGLATPLQSENSLVINGSPGYDVGRLLVTNIMSDAAANYITMEWHGVTPLISGSIKPEFKTLGATLRFARLEGWDVRFLK